MTWKEMLGPERLARRLFWTKPWGLIQGCTPISPGCLHCWLAEQAHRGQFQKNPKIRAQYQGLTYLKNGIPTFTGTVRLHPERLDIPLRTRKPQVFAIWSDIGHPEVDNHFRARAFSKMILAPQHLFLIITKRPENLLAFYQEWEVDKLFLHAPNRLKRHGISWPIPNIYLLITSEKQEQADKRIPIALQTPVAKRVVLYEPALGPVNFRPWLIPGLESWCEGHPESPDPDWPGGYSRKNPGFDGVIAGGETSPHARPAHPDWFRQIRDDCVAAGVPFFFKSWGKYAPYQNNGPLPPNCFYLGIDGTIRPGDAEADSDQCMGPNRTKTRILDGHTWEELSE